MANSRKTPLEMCRIDMADRLGNVEILVYSLGQTVLFQRIFMTMGAMAKKATGKISAGTPVRVKPGVNAPEFPDVSIQGWTGVVTEVSKRKAGVQYMIEWDDTTLDAMPKSYLDLCEQKQLYHRMACLTADDLEPADG